MPEFVTINAQMCSTLEESSHHIGSYIVYRQSADPEDWACSCPAYRFDKDKKDCKHIKKFKNERCTWHSQFGKAQTEQQKKDMICPECGGPTVAVGFAV